MKNFKNTTGFSLAEMIVSVAVIGILFAAVSTVVTRFLESRIQASEFIQVQDETYVHVQQLESLLKDAQDVISVPSNITGSHYRFDNLLIRNEVYSDAPFVLVRPFKKTVDAPEGSLNRLDDLYAVNKDIEEEFYMSVSDLYLWSDIVAQDDAGRMLIYPNPNTGEIILFDTTKPKTDLISHGIKVQFEDGDFVMPTGIEKKDETRFFISDRSDHTVWEIQLDVSQLDQGIVTGVKSKIIGASQVAGALPCDELQSAEEIGCELSLLNQPNGLAWYDGILYIVDSGNHRALTWDGGEVTELIANEEYESGNSEHETFALEFYMNTPVDVALSPDGDVYVSDSFNHRVLRLAGGEDEVEVVAGTGDRGFSGDFGDARLAQMEFPTGLFFQGDQNEDYPDFIDKIELLSDTILIKFNRDIEGDTFVDDFRIETSGGLLTARGVEVDASEMRIDVNTALVDSVVYRGATLNFVMDEDADPQVVPSFSHTLNTQALSISDSGNNAVRKLYFSSIEEGGEMKNLGIIATQIGDAHSVIIPQNYVSKLLSQRATEFDRNLGHQIISRKVPVSGQRELDPLIAEGDDGLRMVYKLPFMNEAIMHFNTGLFVNKYGDTFVVDALNNQIKMAIVSENMLTSDVLNRPQPALTVNLGGLTSERLRNTVFPVVRDDDFRNYNFNFHVMTGEKDYISPFPLKNMFFTVSGIQNKIVQSNISVYGREVNGIASNNFQFSLSLRNPVEN